MISDLATQNKALDLDIRLHPFLILSLVILQPTLDQAMMNHQDLNTQAHLGLILSHHLLILQDPAISQVQVLSLDILRIPLFI